MDFCENHKCIQCCLDAQVALLNEDVSRLNARGYYDAYFVEERDGVKFLRRWSDGCCVFYDKDSGNCEIYDARPEECRLRPYTICNGNSEPGIDKGCKFCNECTDNPELRKKMKKFFNKLQEEIAWRRKTGYF